MVTVMEPPHAVRPQNPAQPFEPAANQTQKRQVMIDVREVDFTYGDNKVLHNISQIGRASCRERVFRAV